MKSIVICEKPSQAKAIRTAIGSRYGEVLPAAGHLLTLKEPDEVNPEWSGQWRPGLLWPGTFYPKKVIPETKRYFDAIRDAARHVDQIVIATDCDREGQLIGGEIVDHIGFRGRVLRAIFNAEDAKSLQDAFGKLRPNEEFRGLYDSGRAREQADQTTNLSLTRTVTCAFKAPGAKGAIGIGRVKSPVLGIICQREKEIRDFRPQDYFLIDAATEVPAGRLTLTCSAIPASLLREQDGAAQASEDEELDENDAALETVEPLRGKIMKREIADALAAAVRGHSGPLDARADRRKQGPPRLFDLTALQSTASARFGWSGEKTLDIAQKLYSDRTLITYPRGEAKYLPENNIADIRSLLPALLCLPGLAEHARLLARPEVRKGKSGHFSDKALEGFSHHAIIPNVNTAETFSHAVPALSGDEARLFDLIARQYLAALAPDHEYLQTTIDLSYPWKGHVWLFRASGRTPIIQGWKAILGGGGTKDADDQPELPAVRKGETGQVRDSAVRSVTTKPPARYTEGSLIRVMQEAWRLVPPGDLRERLRDAKGIGTPATRGEVVKGLKQQGQIVEKGKSLMPTEGGMKLWELLRAVCPNVVDPARTALWETIFDGVEKRKITPEAAVERILQETSKEILAITGSQGQGVIAIGKSGKPTEKMAALARSIAERKKIKLPAAVLSDSGRCRAFLDEHLGPRSGTGSGQAGESSSTEGGGPRPASEKQIALARSLSERTGREIPAAALANPGALSAWIDEAMKAAPPRAPSEKQVDFARSLAQSAGVEVPATALADAGACSKFIESLKGKSGSGGDGRSGGRGQSGSSRPSGPPSSVSALPRLERRRC